MDKIVLNSNGFQAEFDKKKIVDSLLKETSISKEMAEKVARSIERKVNSIEHVTGSLLRGLTLDYLVRHGMLDIYREYKRVGLPISDVRKIWSVQGDSIHENANIDASNPEGIHKHLADALSKEAALELLPMHLSSLHNDGSLHIHDLEYFFTRFFCFDSDLRYVFKNGLYPDGTGAGMPVAGPAMNAEVAILHAAKTLGCMQCMCAGGQGFQNFLTFLSPYLEGKTYKEVKQLAQMFIYEMAQMMVARGAQAVFSSIQLTPGVPKIWRDKPAVYKGMVGPRTYGEFEDEVQMAFMAFMDVFEHGDFFGKPFSFPKPEVVLSRDFMGEAYKKLYHAAFRVIAKNGSVYLENQLHSKEGIVECVQCCAYRWEKSDRDIDFNQQLSFTDGKHFSLGSMQVVTLNVPRAAYIGGSHGVAKGVMNELKRLVDAAIEIFQIKRDAVMKQPLPFARQTPGNNPPFADIKGLSYVIGVVGINEAVQYLTGKQLHESKEAWKMAVRMMTELDIYVHDKSIELDMPLTLARTPAETTAQRFAVSDLLDTRFAAAIIEHHLVKGDLSKALADMHKCRDLPIEYSNGCHLAVDAPVSLDEKMRLEEPFFAIFRGGNIFHIFMRDIEPYFDMTDVTPELERIPVYDSPVFDLMVNCLMSRVMAVAQNALLGYIKISKDTTICLDCHVVRSGLYESCRNCGSANVTQMALVTGYAGNLKNFNEAKKQEVKDRHRYDISEVSG
jgi:ribonucleoside-triphosphate reductase (formate)